jgi:hypothetical protein
MSGNGKHLKLLLFLSEVVKLATAEEALSS